MVNYREILRLGSDPKNSQRSIELALRCSHHTIRDVLDAASKAGVHWPLDESVSNEALRELLFPTKNMPTELYAAPDFPRIHKELARPGVNLTLLWTEYCRWCEAVGSKPYMYTQFCERYRKWARITKATMRIQRKPGDLMEVDWAGNTLNIYDHVTGDVSKAYLFIAVLPCSGFAYAELCEDMKQENWLLCHVHAYAYFGGVTRLLVPDNLKTGVASNTRYETVLNKSYQEMSEHYETTIVPARVRHPKDKSHAEGAVKMASTWILAALRDRKFFSIAEGKEAVAGKLEELNDRPFKSKDGCRRSAYMAEEKEFMQPLPSAPYEPAMWTPELRVGIDYLVSDGMNKYSVPFDLIGEKVVLRITKDMVEVFYKGSRVASHIRERVAKRNPIINPEHMTPEHKKYLSYNVDDFTSWAKSVGKNTAFVVKCFLSSGREAEQGFKYCAGAARLAERYGNARLEDACKYLLSFSDAPSLRTLAAILKNNYGQNHKKNTAPNKERPKPKGITRGAAYYKRGGNADD